MTLVLRLLAALLAGAILWLVMVKVLYPKPAYYGQYVSQSKKGDYVLKFDRRSVILIYTDPSKNRFAYRGPVHAENSVLTVKWSEKINGEKWEPLQNATNIKMKFNPPDQVVTQEGNFQRVPISGWLHWFL